MTHPTYREILYQNPLKIFHHFSSQTGAVFLDSAQLMKDCGRYSFIAMDPFLIMQSKNENLSADPFSLLEIELAKYPLNFHPELPPFQGGVVGYFSYDLCQHLEKLPITTDDMQFPDLILGFYDLVIAFDNEAQRAWIFSSGYPKQDAAERAIYAEKRMDDLQEKLISISDMPPLKSVCIPEKNIETNFTQASYEIAVKKVIEYILAGDIFEANISQRFKAQLPSELSSFELYRRLRILNPAPFSAYLNWGDKVIASASPERFLQLTNGHVETRPIKGTRSRGKNIEEDQSYAEELLASEKDRAENVMIVDLLRNDLSRVCADHSVNVPQLCGLESYATVHHLVSVVRGELQPQYNVIDLLRATFPGGSITGAPKIRAMEIIAEIEPTQRGPYCGSVGYIGFNGDFDSSITIRTYAIKNNTVTFQAGGAVVSDSDPREEYLETLVKARALRRALIEVVEDYDIAN
jgi:para-aminobenzoate synthetase component 1